MARAIRHVSMREGHDPAEFALLCYGGAAPQHACRVADALGIREILIHPLAGVLSAWGIGLADRRLVRRQSLERRARRRRRMRRSTPRSRRSPAASRRRCRAQGAEPRDVRMHRALELRAPGTETALAVAHAPLPDVLRDFRAAFTRRFGFAPPAAAPLVATLRVEAVVAGERRCRRHGRAGRTVARPARRGVVRRLARGAAASSAPRSLPRSRSRGPALIVEPNSTTVVEPGWSRRAPR